MCRLSWLQLALGPRDDPPVTCPASPYAWQTLPLFGLSCSRGQALVETAVTLLLLITLVTGIVVVGQGMRTALGIQVAAREAALTAAQANSENGAIALAQARAIAVAADYGLVPADLGIVIRFPDGFVRGGRVVVSATGHVHPRWLPLVAATDYHVTREHQERIDLFRSLDG